MNRGNEKRFLGKLWTVPKGIPHTPFRSFICKIKAWRVKNSRRNDRRRFDWYFHEIKTFLDHDSWSKHDNGVFGTKENSNVRESDSSQNVTGGISCD